MSLVNRNAQANGDHEVHTAGCSYMPDRQNCVALSATSHHAVQRSVRQRSTMRRMGATTARTLVTRRESRSVISP